MDLVFPSSTPDLKRDPEDPPLRFLIVQDYKENRRKCTALDLRGLEGIEFLRLRRPANDEAAIEVPGGIWLEVDAPVLEREDRKQLRETDRVVVLDSSWARLAPLRRRLRVSGPVHRRSLPGTLRTAYPRRSKLYEDPRGGLATVEAVFSVTVIFGRPRPELLSSYRWRDDFLQLNRSAFERSNRGADRIG